MLWCFVTDLTDRGVLILWEGSAMDRAMPKLMPMCEYGFEQREGVVAAQDQARVFLGRLQGDGLYRRSTACTDSRIPAMTAIRIRADYGGWGLHRSPSPTRSSAS